MAGTKTFSYTAFSPANGRRKGKMEAESSAVVSATLQADGLIPLNISEYSKSLSTINITKPKEEQEAKLKGGDVVVFARQLYLLVRSGLPMARSLAIMGEDHPDIRFTNMCSDLSRQVLSGVSLSKAMTGYPKAFDDVVVAYIAAGEETGNMEEALFRLSKMLEKGHSLKLKVKAVTAYPKMVGSAIGVVVVIIMMFLVPSFAEIYDGFGAELPAPTQLMVTMSGYMPFILVGLLAAFFGLKFWLKKQADNVELLAKLDRMKFKFPVMGKLWKFSMLYRWSSTMGGALQSGLQTYVALELAGRTAGSAWVRTVSEELREAVRVGRPLSSELAYHPELFSPQLRSMAQTGEESGEIAEMFDNVAMTLEDEIEAMIAVLGARLEVVLLVLMGSVVGAMVVVLYLPIFGLSNAAIDGY